VNSRQNPLNFVMLQEVEDLWNPQLVCTSCRSGH
jgi:hypothetical protein